MVVRSAYGSSNSSVKHHSETQIIKNTVVKQSKGLNGDLKPEHKKFTHRTNMSPPTDIGSQAPTLSKTGLKRELSFSLRIDPTSCN